MWLPYLQATNSLIMDNLSSIITHVSLHMLAMLLKCIKLDLSFLNGVSIEQKSAPINCMALCTVFLIMCFPTIFLM